MTDKTLTIEGVEPLLLFGFNDQYLRKIEAAFADTRITARGHQVILQGDESEIRRIEQILGELTRVLTRNGNLTERDVDTVLDLTSADGGFARADTTDVILFTPTGGVVKAKTPGQIRLVETARKNDIVFAVGPAGTGKCVASGTLVLTTDGLRPIDELAGDAPEGQSLPRAIEVDTLAGPTRTSHVYNGGLSPTLRLTTRHGFDVEVTPEHPLLTLTPEGGYAWLRAEEIRPGTPVALRRGSNLFGSRTAVRFRYAHAPHDTTSREVLLDRLDTDFAYFMGIVVGDGHLRAADRGTGGALVLVSTGDAEVGAHVEATCERFGLRAPRHGYDYRIGSVQLHGLLRHLGVAERLSHEKAVPPSILRAPRRQVVAFLQGLFDADGTVDRRGGAVSLSTSSEQLAREVQMLLLNLGLVATRHRRPTSRRDSYRLTLYGAEADRFFDVVGFRLTRKQALRRPAPRSNPNVDVVPNVHALIDAAVRARRFSRAEHKRLADYRTGRRRPSYAQLHKLLALFGPGEDEAVQALRRIADDHLLWSDVTAIAPGAAQVYDLTVPEQHHFVADGFVSHNTYTAVALAVSALKSRQVKRLVLSRPAVEAGESLGFLPGDFRDKIDPYLRPLYDALEDMIRREKLSMYLDENTVEIVPLAYMRGRAQPLSSRVLTPEGWVQMGDLRVGDTVIGSDGHPTAVTGVFPQGEREVYSVITTDGATTRCCGEHLWSVYTRSDRRRGKPARVLRTDEMIGDLRCHHYHRYELPLLSSPAAFPPRDVVVAPYALGLLLGDGCFRGGSPTFTTADPELADALDERLPGVEVKSKSGYDYWLTKPSGTPARLANPLTDALRALDLYGTYSHSTFVPPAYLLNTADVRLAVLQGLLDSDGGPVTQAGRTCRIQYATTSPRLCDDVLFLVRSLGGTATTRMRRAKGRPAGEADGRPVPHRRDAYVLDIRLPEGMPPFRLRRKAKAYEEHGGGRPMRYVTRIEPAGTEPTQCIRVAAADSLYVTDDFLLTHNTLSNAFVILDEAQNATAAQMKMFLTRLGPGSRCIVTGDVTQTDLPRRSDSGLVHATRILHDVDGIEFVEFNRGDVVRHRLVMDIIEAYEKHAEEED